jgi:hypothetical protein
MHSLVREPRANEGRWKRAMAALVRAQDAFAEIELSADATDAAFRRAWMGLWRAERYQIALMRREQHE